MKIGWRGCLPLKLRIASHVASFHSSPRAGQQLDKIGTLAQLVMNEIPRDASLSQILHGVWKNEVITSQCPDLVIRLTSLRGEVSKRIWKMKGGDPNTINILAVGSVSIPQHLPSYHHFLENFYRRSSETSLAWIGKDHNFEVGYDLLSKGSDIARSKVFQLFNEHYGFSESLLAKCIENSAITSGGMRGLKDLADACVLLAKAAGNSHRFIQPDNSFGTWWNIIERPVKMDSNRREIYSIEGKPINRLHITAEDVREFYQKNKPVPNESWYITPVGNPSGNLVSFLIDKTGTKMTANQLYSTCEAILEQNPKAIIILDTVYARTLDANDAKALMKDVVSNKKMLDHIVWLESFSKSHGLCRERLGIYFSTNDELFTRVHTANIAFSAGPGLSKGKAGSSVYKSVDFQFMALGDSTPEDKKGISALHNFWMTERRGLYNFLMTKHSTLFDSKQLHINSEDMNKPCTLYICMKTKEGIKAQDVFIQTGALGVDTPLLSGHHIRFSLGQQIKPTYSMYA